VPLPTVRPNAAEHCVMAIQKESPSLILFTSTSRNAFRLTVPLLLILTTGCVSVINHIIEKRTGRGFEKEKLPVQVGNDRPITVSTSCEELPDSILFQKQSWTPARSDSAVMGELENIRDSLVRIMKDSSFGVGSLEYVLTINPNGKLYGKRLNGTPDSSAESRFRKILDQTTFDSVPNYQRFLDFYLRIKKTEGYWQGSFQDHRFSSPLRTRESILKTVMNEVHSLRYAYNMRLREVPGLRGKVVVKFEINSIGDVTRARIESSTMNDSQFERTVIDKVTRWKFCREYSGYRISEVIYPFVFSQ